MANSSLQLSGLLLSLIGVSASIAAIFMVEWKKEVEGIERSHTGLWSTCSNTQKKTICEAHTSILKLPTEIQATRAVMLVSLLFSATAMVLSVVGMKCTRFMEELSEGKNKAAAVGGGLFVASGLMTVIITSWYISTVVSANQKSIQQTTEFGEAAFVSLGGGFFTFLGGCFLACQRLKLSKSSTSSSPSQPMLETKSNYV